MNFQIPKKTILTHEDLALFQKSNAYNLIVDFILALNESVKGLTTRTEVVLDDLTKNLLNLLDTLINLIDEIEPEPVGKSRFGNPAFRTWYDKAKIIIQERLENFITPTESVKEISKYLTESFGNYQRIDYGTGHEFNFICFLFCLFKLNLLKEELFNTTVLRIFYKYISLMRHLQFKYWLEPAGSHGVWGLDDYHFLPFLFGSSQLLGHPHIKPKSIHNNDIVEEFSKDYQYLACIKFVNSVKSESLRWHSPMLDDISGVKTWDKVNSGMIKMYKAEVLNKLPIAQHFLFGSIISFETGHVVPDDEHDHSHVYAFGQEAPQCCSVRMPSAIGAKSVNDGKSNESRPMRLPFD